MIERDQTPFGAMSRVVRNGLEQVVDAYEVRPPDGDMPAVVVRACNTDVTVLFEEDVRDTRTVLEELERNVVQLNELHREARGE